MQNTKKIKIAFCIPNMVIGGVETVFAATMNELLKNPDLEIQLVTHAAIREPMYKEWINSNPGLRPFVYYPLCNRFEDMAPKCRGILKILRKIAFSLYKKYRRAIVRLSGRLDDFDIFVDYKNMEFFKELRHYKQPKIAWLHSSVGYFESCGTISRMDKYDKIVSITNDFIKDVAKTYPRHTNKVSCIYNVIDTDTIKSRAKDAETPDGKYFAHVSRLVAGKDIRTLLDAFEKFCKDHDDIKLYIVGDGDMADDFKKYAATLKSCKNIVFTGAMQNPYGIMRGAIANILSSEYEGFGMVLVESMALGRPMISSDCKCGPREILQDGRSGLLFDVGNSDQLAECMKQIAQDTHAAKEMARRAEQSLYRFAPSEAARQILDLIREQIG